MSRDDKKRPERKRKGGIPLGVYHTKMDVPPGLIPPDRVGLWVNDDVGHIERALAADWEFVTTKEKIDVGAGYENMNTDIGSKVSIVVGVNEQNKPQRAYLMMIYRDWYEEDQKEKQKPLDEVERALKNPGFGTEQKGIDKSGTYGKVDYKA